jgi:hypothetical protein
MRVEPANRTFRMLKAEEAERQRREDEYKRQQEADRRETE